MIVLIVAFDEARMMGNHGQLPWHIPSDLKHFRRVTTGHTVVMGRTTFSSIGKPLPQRENYVVTSHPETLPRISGLHGISSLEEFLRQWKSSEQPLYVIGGLSVYEQALPWADSLLVSYIPGIHQGDKKFPLFEDDFTVVREVNYDDFRLIEYRRRSPQ
jgi:dihydrofolate reductase